MPAPFDSLRSSIPNVAWPPLVQGVAALVEAYVARLEVTEWLPLERIEEAQRQQLGMFAGHCARHSPAFARRLAAARLTAADLARPGGLAKLPPLTRRGLQDRDGLFCDSVPEAHQPTGMTQTSGSTGEPTQVMRTGLNKLGHMAMTVRDHRWQRRDARGRLAAMSAHRHEVTPLADWGEPLALLYRTGPGLALPATMAVAELHQRIADFAPQVGRERNLVVLPDGSRHWPLTGYSKFHGIAPIRHYQLIQRDLETIEMRLVVARPLSPEQEDKLKAQIQVSVGYPFAIRLTYFADTLPVDPTGKREEFVSLVG